jgi:uncharacterized protein with PhoU and TrkA domain
MSKKEQNELSNEMMMADALLRLRALENLLMAKGVFTQEEFSQEMSGIAAQIAKTILQKANIPGDLDELIKSLQEPKKKVEGN